MATPSQMIDVLGGRKIVTIQHSAAHTTSYVPDADYIIAAVEQTATILISKDSADTVANFTTPTANQVKETIVFGSNSTGIRGGLNIPILKGETLLITSTAAGSFMLYLEPFG